MKYDNIIKTGQDITGGFRFGKFSSVAVNGTVSGEVEIGKHSYAVIRGDVRSRGGRIRIGRHSAVLFGGDIHAYMVDFAPHSEVKVNGNIDATQVDFRKHSDVKVDGNVETEYGCHVSDLSRVSIGGNVSPSSDDLQDKKDREPRLSRIRSSSISGKVEAQKHQIVSTKDEDVIVHR